MVQQDHWSLRLAKEQAGQLRQDVDVQLCWLARRLEASGRSALEEHQHTHTQPPESPDGPGKL